MVCLLCLEVSPEAIEILGEIGEELRIAKILEQHFWFRPVKEEGISTVICQTCWLRVNDFHEFYVQVEQAHSLLTKESCNNVEEPEVKVFPEPETIIIEPEPNLETKLLPHDCEEPLMMPVDIVKTEEKDLFADTTEVLPQAPVRRSKRSCAKQRETCKVPKSRKAKTLRGKRRKKEPPVIEQESEEEDEGTKQPPLTEKVPQNEDEEKSVDEIKQRTAKPLRSKRRRKEPAVIGKEAQSEDEAKQLPVTEKEPQNEDEEKSVDENSSTALKKTREDSRKIDQMISDYMKLFCPVCHEEKATFAKLKRHMEEDHQKRTGYAVCCNKKFRQRCQLADHVKHHLDPSYFKCKECQRVFADGQCLRNHILALHQPDEKKVFHCPDCPKRYAKAFLLRYHRLVWHAERNHMCHICNKGYPSQPLLKSHIKVFHGDYGIVCELCAKVLKGRGAYERHKLEHAGLPMPKVQCTTCGAWLAHSRSLKRHMKLQHSEGSQEVKCPDCDKVCANEWALDVHHRNMHTAERVHACTLCDKRFKKAINLKEHMATHTGETLYTCSFCPQTFKSKANMYAHRKKKHPDEYQKDLEKRIKARFSLPNGPTEEELVVN